MKVLVAYSSKTGATKKVAEAIHAYNTAWDILPMEAVTDIAGYDLIIPGGWIDKGTYDAKAMAFISGLKEKNVAFFFTLGAYPTCKHAYDCVRAISKVLEEGGNRVVNHFHCQGAIDEKLMAWMRGLGKEHAHAADGYREKRWANAAKHPNQEDFDAAENFADSTMKYYQAMEKEHV